MCRDRRRVPQAPCTAAPVGRAAASAGQEAHVAGRWKANPRRQGAKDGRQAASGTQFSAWGPCRLGVSWGPGGGGRGAWAGKVGARSGEERMWGMLGRELGGNGGRQCTPWTGRASRRRRRPPTAPRGSGRTPPRAHRRGRQCGSSGPPAPWPALLPPRVSSPAALRKIYSATGSWSKWDCIPPLLSYSFHMVAAAAAVARRRRRRRRRWWRWRWRWTPGPVGCSFLPASRLAAREVAAHLPRQFVREPFLGMGARAAAQRPGGGLRLVQLHARPQQVVHPRRPVACMRQPARPPLR